MTEDKGPSLTEYLLLTLLISLCIVGTFLIYGWAQR